MEPKVSYAMYTNCAYFTSCFWNEVKKVWYDRSEDTFVRVTLLTATLIQNWNENFCLGLNQTFINKILLLEI